MGTRQPAHASTRLTLLPGDLNPTERAESTDINRRFVEPARPVLRSPASRAGQAGYLSHVVGLQHGTSRTLSCTHRAGLTVRHESRSGLRCGRRSPRAQTSLHRGWNAPGMRDICPGLRDFAVPTWWAHAEFAYRLVRKTAVPLRETKVSVNTFTSYCELNRYRIAIAPREIRSPTGNRDLETGSMEVACVGCWLCLVFSY